MFDKILYDRNAYDRSVSSDGFLAPLSSTSRFSINVIFRAPIILTQFSGSSRFDPKIIFTQQLSQVYDGKGDFGETELILRTRMSCHMSGSGNLEPNINAKIPISKMALSGSGDFKNSEMHIYQTMESTLRGEGEFITKPIFIFSFGETELSGIGDLKGILRIIQFMKAPLTGNGDFVLRRLSALNENIFELDGISLNPGESVTIDTDLLSVMFGNREDVSSVTSDSAFFELSPGENDIQIETDANGPLNVTAIWQNRWL